MLLTAFTFSFFVSIVALLFLIKFLRRREVYQTVRTDVMDTHVYTKKGKPTMGGVVANVVFLLSALLFTDRNVYVMQAVVISVFFGTLGFIDDYIKVFRRDVNGFRGSVKLILQLGICGLIITYSILVGLPFMDGNLQLPFGLNLHLGVLQGVFLMCVITGSANAVNITDGLDGLAIIPIIFTALAFLFKTHDESISVLCASILGVGLAFFGFNKYPAKIFMGDVGSLFYGSLLAYISIVLRQEMFYAIACLLFVIEILTSTIQVFTHFFWGKRIFKAAPLHHHFEKCGLREQTIILYFWFFYFICLAVAMLIV